MTIEQYLEWAPTLESPHKINIPIESLTLACHDPEDGPTRLLHAALGLPTEALELAAAINGNLPIASQIEEMGDICWFCALAIKELGHAPTQVDVSAAPKAGIVSVYKMCEEFASRIKAAIFYGSPSKPSDPTPDSWMQLPGRILARLLAISNAQLTLGRNHILDANMAKLRKRYPNKFTAFDAVNRNTVGELHAISLLSSQVPQPTAAPAPKKPVGEMQDMPNRIAVAAEKRDFVIVSDKELKEVLESGAQRRTMSQLLRKTPNPGVVDGQPDTKPAPGQDPDNT